MLVVFLNELKLKDYPKSFVILESGEIFVNSDDSFRWEFIIKSLEFIVLLHPELLNQS